MSPRLRLALLPALLLVAACVDPSTPDDSVGSTAARIVYGTPDTGHSAVVAVMSADNSGMYECTGTIVQNVNGLAYILTAAHCCSNPTPTAIVLGTDCNPGYTYLQNGGTPQPPVYAIVSGSVKSDPQYNPNASAPIHDFCMLKANVPASTPVIPVATGTDGLSVGVTVEYVGFGVTQSDQNNTICEHASAPVDQSVTSTYFRYTEGGSTHIGGPCEGDSGGPALLPAGVPQSQQKVVGTTSYGDANCTQYGVSMRVTSATGAGGFISTYLGTATTTDGGVQADAGGGHLDAAAQADGGAAHDAAVHTDGAAVDSGATGNDAATALADGGASNNPPPLVVPDGGSSGGGAVTGGGGGTDGSGTSGGCTVAGAGSAPSWLLLALAGAVALGGRAHTRRSRRGRRR